MRISDCEVHKVFVGTGSSADIIYYGAYKMMEIGKDKLISTNIPLISFSRDIVLPMGYIRLPVRIGTYPKDSQVYMVFIVVDLPSAHDAILGRPRMKALMAVASPVHQVMKFPTPRGSGEVLGNQLLAR
ncbi:hypothetical protein NE237_029560 [Protea cynaroides]|uniref:Uncharacterized protein n=1 Tax=Protea cynaroides TaxID=273540 RepID=A0A9Q0JWD4_9MAGN|nr:hypothetical protein NE237_029560 [Protea cynaroides]